MLLLVVMVVVGVGVFVFRVVLVAVQGAYAFFLLAVDVVAFWCWVAKVF